MIQSQQKYFYFLKKLLLSLLFAIWGLHSLMGLSSHGGFCAPQFSSDIQRDGCLSVTSNIFSDIYALVPSYSISTPDKLRNKRRELLAAGTSQTCDFSIMPALALIGLFFEFFLRRHMRMNAVLSLVAYFSPGNGGRIRRYFALLI